MGEPSRKRARRDAEEVEVYVIPGSESSNGIGEENQNSLIPIGRPMVLPENWMAMLDEMSPPDFLSAINTCQKWSEQIHYRKTTKLFPLVLPILFRERHLTQKQALPLRRVSQLYKKAVDNCLQRSGTNPGVDFQLSALVTFTRQKHPCNFNIIKEVQPLLTKTESWLSPMGNPFLSGCVTLIIHNNKEEKAKLRFLLKRFGHHISTLKLQLPVVVQKSTISTIISLLNTNLPNLRMLSLNGSIPKRLLQFLRNYQQQFPNLEKLVSLNLNGLQVPESRRRVLLYKTFLGKYGTQITVFYGDLRFFQSPKVTVDLLNEQLPNVEMLDATVKMEGLEKISKVGWKLKALRLNTTAAYQNGGGRDGKMFCNIMKAVNNFSESLRYLHLDFKLYEKDESSGPKTRAKSSEERKEWRVLPNLEQLQTTVPKRNLGRFWDFLETSCPNLRWLHFIVQAENSGEKVSGNNDLGKKAFRVAPKLRKIWFRGRNQKTFRMERGDYTL